MAEKATTPLKIAAKDTEAMSSRLTPTAKKARMTSPDTAAREQPQNSVGSVPTEATTHAELLEEDAELEADDGYADSAIGTDSS